MPIRMWNGVDGWLDGEIGVSPGDDDPLVNGTVKMWPWSGAQDLIGGLRYPIIAAEGFGSGEWNGHTLYAANQLFTKDSLATLQPYRMVGVVDVHKLSGESGANSLVLSATAPGAVTTASGWAAVNVTSPIGAIVQPASFWDNSSYQAKSVAPVWTSSRVIIARVRDSGAATALKDWIVANDAQNTVIISSSTYATCTSLVATPNLKVIYEVTSGYPGDGTVAAPDTLFGLGIHGVMMPSSNTTPTIVNNCRLEGLKFHVTGVTIATNAAGFASMGCEGIHTTLPSTVAVTALPPNPDPDPDPGGGDPPTANIGTWWGWNTQGNSNLNDQVNAGLTEIGVVRWFEGGSPSARNASNVLTAVPPTLSQATAIWITYKPTAAQMEAPSTCVADTMTLLKGAYGKTRPIFVAFWHEPEGNIPSGWTISRWAAAWRNGNGALYDACIAARAEGYQFWTAPIVCDWNFTNNKAGGMNSWYPSTWLDYDIMGFDCYPTGQSMDNNLEQRVCRLRTDGPNQPAPYVYAEGSTIQRRMPGKSGTDPRHDSYGYINKCAALAAARNKPWGSGECGINPSSTYGGDSFEPFTHAQRAQRFRDIYNHCLSLANPPRLWTWWKQDTPSEIDAIFNESVRSNPTSAPRP